MTEESEAKAAARTTRKPGKSEDEAGREKLGNWLPSNFVFRSLFENLDLKGYVGGLGASAFNCLHIGLVASAMI